MDEFIFTAPDGCPIQGLMQHDNATWAIRWVENDPTKIDYIDAAAPDGADWNTVEWHDQPLYIDNNATTWFAHHLIPAGDEERSPDVIALMLEEVAWTRRAHLMREIALTFDHNEEREAYRAWKRNATVLLDLAAAAGDHWRAMVTAGPDPAAALAMDASHLGGAK